MTEKYSQVQKERMFSLNAGYEYHDERGTMKRKGEGDESSPVDEHIICVCVFYLYEGKDTSASRLNPTTSSSVSTSPTATPAHNKHDASKAEVINSW